MRISELMIRDIRATVEFGDETIIVKNPKGEVKAELLTFFKGQLDKNMDNAAKTKGRKKKIASNLDILKLLMEKLTNIELDVDTFEEIVKNPSYELNVVLLYLASIMQELIFEVLSTHNLEMRMEQNTLLEKDTLNRVGNLEDLIKEIKHRKMMENGENI
ncbi:MAG: hypothetical protein ACRC18_07220 [Cetobacterium sp.]